MRQVRPRKSWRGTAGMGSECCVYMGNSGKPHPISEQCPQLHHRTTVSPTSLARPSAPVWFQAEGQECSQMVGVKSMRNMQRYGPGQGSRRNKSIAKRSEFAGGVGRLPVQKKRTQCGPRLLEPHLCDDTCSVIQHTWSVISCQFPALPIPLLFSHLKINYLATSLTYFTTSSPPPPLSLLLILPCLFCFVSFP